METVVKVKPKVRTKEFADYGNVSNIGVSNKEIYNRLLKAKNSIYFNNQSNENKNIFNKVLKSYDKIFNKNNLKDEDFILSNHELFEFSKIESSKIVRYVIYRYKYNIYPKLRILDKYPQCLQIEPTSICNFRCVICYQVDKSFSGKSHGHMGYMSLDVFKKVIDEVEGKIEAITLASRGEPTLNPKLENMLRYMDGKFLGTKINTNASMFNEKLINVLLSSNLQTIVFSIDSINKKDYEKIRVNGKFDKIMRNIELFHKIKSTNYSNSNTIIRVSGVKLNEKQSFGEMKSFWDGFADSVSLTNYNPWESAYDNKINTVIEPCSTLWRLAYLWWDGKVNPCDYDYKSTLTRFEDLVFPEMSITDVWTSDFYNKLRESHLENKRKNIEPCKRCVQI